MTETFDEILRKALQFHGSDIFVVPGSQIMTKVSGKMIPITEEKALPNDIAVLELKSIVHCLDPIMQCPDSGTAIMEPQPAPVQKDATLGLCCRNRKRNIRDITGPPNASDRLSV